ncbi:hypothetical protein BGZ60DRAFT_417594 [Tricladium varicosporioides]|nr:hypothetical protein BGZ60DRAFT_417594 [Hymenoscyphus varicosporioides]
MGMEFELFFGGPEHSYAATVTRTNGHRVPVAASPPIFYGFPQTFEESFANFLQTSPFPHVYNVRGHDFLAYAGQHMSKNLASGSLTTLPRLHSPPSAPQVTVIYDEIRQLRIFAAADQRSSELKVNLKTSYGPTAGSFFADSFTPRGLKRYRWSNLPSDLENELQDLLGNGGYEKARIQDVCMNRDGGWVVVSKDGQRYIWGGNLPHDLVAALLVGKESKIRIDRIFLNHQHPTEYLLLMGNGEVYARLHEDFREPLQKLSKEWATGNKLSRNYRFRFYPSCHCSKVQQAEQNAAYYNARGIFHLNRGNDLLAYQYLKAAHELHGSNAFIRRNYALALLEHQRILQDPILVRVLLGEPNSSAGLNAAFRLDYLSMNTTITPLRARLLQGQIIDFGEVQEEWSYRDGNWAAKQEIKLRSRIGQTGAELLGQHPAPLGTPSSPAEVA